MKILQGESITFSMRGDDPENKLSDFAIEAVLLHNPMNAIGGLQFRDCECKHFSSIPSCKWSTEAQDADHRIEIETVEKSEFAVFSLKEETSVSMLGRYSMEIAIKGKDVINGTSKVIARDVIDVIPSFNK